MTIYIFFKVYRRFSAYVKNISIIKRFIQKFHKILTLISKLFEIRLRCFAIHLKKKHVDNQRWTLFNILQRKMYIFAIKTFKNYA